MSRAKSPSARPEGAPVDAAAWRAITSRDARADGRFVYAVRTTGVFCRPSCASRQPLRANVRVFADPPAALAGGFRACLRCRPGEPARPRATPPALARACRLLAREDEEVRCEDVAAALALSPAALTRLFRTHLGVTPTAYRRRVRAERGREALAESASVTEAVYGAGFSAPSRFYAAVAPELGMTPARARRGGEGESLAWASRACSLGRVLVAWTARGVAAVTLGDDDEALVSDLRARFPRASVEAAHAAPPWLGAVLAVVEGKRLAGDIPRDARGTAFQERVWQALAQIPAGETRSYAELAGTLGQPTATRAVARACATNPLAVLVPCHRAVRGDGALAGYRWGLARKRALLDREARRAR